MESQLQKLGQTAKEIINQEVQTDIPQIIETNKDITTSTQQEIFELRDENKKLRDRLRSMQEPKSYVQDSNMEKSDRRIVIDIRPQNSQTKEEDQIHLIKNTDSIHPISSSNRSNKTPNIKESDLEISQSSGKYQENALSRKDEIKGQGQMLKSVEKSINQTPHDQERKSISKPYNESGLIIGSYDAKGNTPVESKFELII